MDQQVTEGHEPEDVLWGWGRGTAPVFSRTPGIWYILLFRLMREKAAGITVPFVHFMDREIARGKQGSLLEISQVVAGPICETQF